MTTTTRARRFTSIDLGNGKVLTPIRSEFGVEFEVAVNGRVIGYRQYRQDATELANEYAASSAGDEAE